MGMEINFQCRKCGRIFDCDIGTVALSEDSERPVFEKSIVCPNCGQRSMDGVFLTELGQGQLTEATLDFDLDDLFDNDPDDPFDHFEGECQGCGLFLPVDHVGLCEECAGKLERDLIRERDWDYSATAFGITPEKREEIRKAVIDRYGERLELILPSRGGKETGSSGKRRKRKARRRNR
jgi:DNA-directed RNA polymerase subunit RPC12/RpoP